MMTTANKITIIRILLVPFFIVQVVYYVNSGHEYHRLLALLAFAVAAISDGVDGYIARRYNQRSELGAILDPLADKLLLVSGIVLLSLDNGDRLPHVPMWLTATILSRDILLLLGLVLIQFVVGKAKVRPIMAGKLATFLQMVMIIWGLLKWNESILVWIAAAATLFTGVSGAYYIYDGIRQLSASPASAASPKQ
jgi:CDP-diacylglycerol--glycerol-3-phosphate 3-phosphatidyltransferase